jgi:hypothetical protein
VGLNVLPATTKDLVDKVEAILTSLANLVGTDTLKPVCDSLVPPIEKATLALIVLAA